MTKLKTKRKATKLKKAPSEPSTVSKTKVKKKVKPLKVIPWGQDKERDRQLHDNFMEYLRVKNLRRYGNSNIDADNKGYDGYDSLRLLDYLKIKPTRIQKADPSVLMKAAIFNLWQWANFCSRLWAETKDLEPPLRRLVNISLSDVFPGAEYEGVLSSYFSSKNSDLWHALGNLGLIKTRIRLILSVRDEWNVKSTIFYKLFDSLRMVNSEKSIWGIMVDIDKDADYSRYPRDAVILYPSNLRKSKEAETYLRQAVDDGYRVVLPFEALKGRSSSIKEIRQSTLYSLLVQSWKGLQPITTESIDSSMGRVAKISKLCDVLLV